MIEARNISKMFDDSVALADVSINVKRVQFMAWWVQTAPGKQHY